MRMSVGPSMGGGRHPQPNGRRRRVGSAPAPAAAASQALPAAAQARCATLDLVRTCSRAERKRCLPIVNSGSMSSELSLIDTAGGAALSSRRLPICGAAAAALRTASAPRGQKEKGPEASGEKSEAAEMRQAGPAGCIPRRVESGAGATGPRLEIWAVTARCMVAGWRGWSASVKEGRSWGWDGPRSHSRFFAAGPGAHVARVREGACPGAGVHL